MLFLHHANVSVRWTDMWYDGIVQDVRIEPDQYIAHKIYYPIDGDLQWHILAHEEVVLPDELCDYDLTAKFKTSKRHCSTLPRVSLLPDTYEAVLRRLVSQRPLEKQTLKSVRHDLERELGLLRNALKSHKRQIATIINSILESIERTTNPEQEAPKPLPELPEPMPESLAEPLLKSLPESLPMPESLPESLPEPLPDSLPEPLPESLPELLKSLPEPLSEGEPLERNAHDKKLTEQTRLEQVEQQSVFHQAISAHLASNTAHRLAVHCATHNVSNKIKRSIVFNLRVNRHLAEMIERSSPDDVCAWSLDDMKTEERLAAVKASRASYHRWRTVVDSDDELLSRSSVESVHSAKTSEETTPAVPVSHQNSKIAQNPKLVQVPAQGLQVGSLEVPGATSHVEQGPMSPPFTARAFQDLTFSKHSAPRAPGPSAELENDLLRVLLSDPDKSRVLWDKSNSRLLLEQQVRSAGGDVVAVKRAIVAAYRRITFRWSNYNDTRLSSKGVCLYGARMYRPHDDC